MKLALAVSGYLELCVQVVEVMICGLNELAIVLLMLTRGEVSFKLLVLEGGLTL